MSPEHITKARDREALKFDVAAQIRKALDEAREAYGAEEWDENEIEAAVLEIVTGEDPGF